MLQPSLWSKPVAAESSIRCHTAPTPSPAPDRASTTSPSPKTREILGVNGCGGTASASWLDGMTAPSSFDGVVWPAVDAAEHPPIWTGDHFEVDGKPVPYLNYERGPTGWSNQLADLVETESDGDRPLAHASLHNVERCLRQAITGLESPCVLEVGCGSGTVLAALRGRFPNVNWVGIEYAEPAIARLALRFSGIPFLLADIQRCPLADGLFDVIICLNVLEHLENDTLALTELRRLLQPGGHLILEVPAAPSLYDAFDNMVGHFRRYRLSGLVAACRDVGFEVIRGSHLGCFIFPMVWGFKRINQCYLAASPDEQWRRVQKTVRAGRRNWMLHIIFSAENFIGRYLPLPFGVRCTIMARRPDV